jgi:hypothetical protein
MNVEVTGWGGSLYKYSATPHPLPGLYMGPLTTPRLIHAEDGNWNIFWNAGKLSMPCNNEFQSNTYIIATIINWIDELVS